MDFALTEEQDLIRDAVAKVCEDFPDEYWAQKDADHEFPWDFYNTMSEAGWIGIAIPEAYGGSGRGITEASIVLEEVAASGAAMNGATPLHLSMFGMEPVVKYGSEEMKQKYLPAVARGELHVAFGVTEPDAGTDTTSIKTAARREGDQYIVRGRKVWTTKALQSERVLLLTRTTPRDEVERRTDGMTLLLAELQRDEVTISPIDKVGRNAVATCEVGLRRFAGQRYRSSGGRGQRIPVSDFWLERRAYFDRRRSAGDWQGCPAQSRRLRQRAGGFWSTNWQKPRCVLSFGRSEDAPGRGRAHDTQGRLDAGQRNSLWGRSQYGEVAGSGCWLSGCGSGYAGSRRLRLRQGIPCRALLAGSTIDANCPHLSRDDLQLCVRACVGSTSILLNALSWLTGSSARYR
jgi:hypothetical protein